MRLALSTVAIMLALALTPAHSQQASISIEGGLDDVLSEILQELARLEGVSENASMATCRRMHRDIAELRRKVAGLRAQLRELGGGASISLSLDITEMTESSQRQETAPPPAPAPVAMPAPAPAPVAMPAPAPEPVQAAATAMAESDFRRLLARIEDESFSSGKLRVLDDAADYAWLTSAQVVRILELFTFSNDQLKALELIARNIVDHENAFEIYAAFTFDNDKEKARAILRSAR